MRKILTYVFWIILIIGLFALGYAAYRYFFASEDQASLPTQVFLECSTDCRDRGQCGVTEDDEAVQVILGAADGPAVEPDSHDRYFVEGTAVEVLATQMRELEQVDGFRFEHKFSNVEERNAFGDIVRTGWVADWCVRYAEP